MKKIKASAIFFFRFLTILSEIKKQGIEMDIEKEFKYYLRVVRDNFANFSGADTNKEYWTFAVFHFIFLIATGGTKIAALASIYYFVTIIPALAASIRRLRDAGYSPWLMLIGLIPFINIALFYFLSRPSQNQSPDLYSS